MTSRSPIHGSLPPRLAIASIAGFWGFYILLMTLRSFMLNPMDAQIELLGLRLLVCLLAMAVTFAFHACLARNPAASLRRRIVLAVALAGIAAAGFAVIELIVYQDPPKCVPPPPDMHKPIADTLLLGGLASKACAASAYISFVIHYVEGYFLMVAWAALYLAFSYAAEKGAWERHAADLRDSARLAELRALRYQVNPHFLFNTLNSLTALVMAGRMAQAEQVIRRMSTFFRMSLTGDPTEDVPLREEIDLQRLYLDIEMVRFPDRLRYSIDIPEALMSASAPGLILQPLVENAVKHGVARSRDIVTIRISARDLDGRLELTVSDDASAPKGVDEGAGIGLRNVANRLAARFGEAGRLDWQAPAEGGFVVVLHFPWILDGR